MALCCTRLPSRLLSLIGEYRSVCGRYLYNDGKLYPFDPDLVNFYDLDVLKGSRSSGKAVKPYYPLEIDGEVEKVPVVLQSPKMRSKWGYSHSVEYNSHSVDVDFDENVPLFHQTMKRLDERVKLICSSNKHLWFKNSKEMNDKVMDFIYSPIVKTNERNGTRYNDSMRMKIKEYRRGGKTHFEAEAFDSTSTRRTPKPIELTDIHAGDHVKCLFHFTKIWIAQKIFTPMDLVQVQKKEAGGGIKVKGYALVEGGE